MAPKVTLHRTSRNTPRFNHNNKETVDCYNNAVTGFAIPTQ